MSREGLRYIRGNRGSAAQGGDMHVSWVAFPSGAEEQCSPHRLATLALHAYHHQQNNRRGGSTPAGLGVTIPFSMSPIATNILACRQIVLCLFAIALHPNAVRAKASAGGI